jgi:hypothetical protein
LLEEKEIAEKNVFTIKEPNKSERNNGLWFLPLLCTAP